MNNTEIKTVELIVNSEQARKKLDELNQKLTQMKAKREQALERGNSKAIQAYAREMKKLETQIQKTESKATAMSRTLGNLDKSTPNKLQQTITILNNELNSGRVLRGSNEWQVLTKALKEAKMELKRVNSELKVAQQIPMIDKIANWGDKWAGVAVNVQAFVQALTGMKNVINQTTSAFAQMEEAEAQVRKYTGLSAEDVSQLNESLKAMDTRTSREQLNALAGDAGRLGITSKEQILDFVEAADQINVALGDDLGEGAVTNVGKLAMLFGEDQRLGLKGAMLATASVINELSQNSSASASYIEDFTARLAGVGKQAGLTQAQIMAYSAVLDANMQQDETSATALSQLITKMYQEPAKFAALAAKDVKEFSRMLKEDANGAVMAFLSSMRAQGGFEKLAPMFEKMGLDGTRATAVLSTMADKLGDIGRMQQLANDAYADATSIGREFSVQNNTVQAQLEKARKRMNDLSVELGEKLMPVATGMARVTSTGIRLLSELITFVSKNATSIATLTAAIVAYNVAANAATIATKAKAAAIVVANTVAKAYHATVNALHAATLLLQLGLAKLQGNWARQSSLMLDVKKAGAAVAMGWGVLAAAAVALAVGIWHAVKRMRELSAEEKALQDIRKHGAEAIVEEKNKLELLHQAAQNETLSLEVRNQAIRKLNSIVPKYNGMLDETTGKYRANEKALTDYCNALQRKYELEGAQDKLREVGKKLADLYIEKAELEEEIKKMEKADKDLRNSYRGPMGGAGYGNGLNPYEFQADRLRYRLKKVQEEIDAQNGINETIKKVYGNELQTVEAKREAAGDPPSSVVTGKAGSWTDPKTLEDKLKEERERIESAANTRRAALIMMYEQGAVTKKEYDERMLDIDLQTLQKQRDIYRQGSNEWNELNLRIAQTSLQVRQREAEYSLRDIERQEAEATEAAKRQLLDGTMTEKQYQKRLDEIKLSHMRKRAAFYEQTGDTEKAKDTNAQADAEELRMQLERKKENLQKAKQMQEEFFKQSLDEREQGELRLLDELVAAGVIAEERKEAFKAEIRKKYDKLREDEQQENDRKKGRKIENPLGEATGISADLVNVFKMLDSLQEKIKDGQDKWQDYAAVAVASLAFVSSALSSVSQLFSAQQQEEEAAVTRRYDAEIKKVGESSTQGKKLEEQKQKELAKVKNKYRKKQMAMEVAQAVLSTAQAAINAYASASKVSFLLGPIAAAMALAAGAVQIAAIKKQHAAEQGYYSGGFTGGTDYRRRAGVVHEGEFVASHLAVRNPNVLPLLRLIDHAQRNNTIASLSASDVSRAIAAPVATAGNTAATAAAPALRVIDTASDETRDVLRRLNENLEAGIHASVSITGEDGFERQWNRYNSMKNRK
jgi:TP901 family phage tail tape measure protein